jgi:Secretion system C-terminal sorting domain
MQKVIAISLSLLLFSLLTADTMIIHLSNGETLAFEISEILEITFGPDVSAEEMVELISQIPITFIKNYPNPFNPTTTISFEITEVGKTQIEVFNAKGQKVRTLLNENLEIGLHSVEWKGNDSNNKRVASGIYFYRISVNGQQKIKKMIMLK